MPDPDSTKAAPTARSVAKPSATLKSTDAPAPPVSEVDTALKAEADKAQTEAEAPPTVVKFVKNINPREQVKLANGKLIDFSGFTFSTTDPDTIKQIREVANLYWIVEA